jgi:hypothetical protein
MGRKRQRETKAKKPIVSQHYRSPVLFALYAISIIVRSGKCDK